MFKNIIEWFSRIAEKHNKPIVIKSGSPPIGNPEELITSIDGKPVEFSWKSVAEIITKRNEEIKKDKDSYNKEQ